MAILMEHSMQRLSLVTLLLSFTAFAADTNEDLLRWMDSIAQKQLDAREAAIAKIHTVADAELRKGLVRRKVLDLIGGLPDYKGPLNARITGSIARPGYVIEKIIFESLPQLYVTGNLYRPDRAGRFPGVLLPLGH